MNNASISKIFDVLKSLVFALSLRNNVSMLFCVCVFQNLTSLKSLLNLLNKCGFFNTGFGPRGVWSWRYLGKYAKSQIHHTLTVSNTLELLAPRFWSESEQFGHASLHTHKPRSEPGYRILTSVWDMDNPANIVVFTSRS